MNFTQTAPVGFALLGLLLGMRHATDPDHVVAITAILSRERRLGAATRVGLIWGLGHTLTVMAVGAAIIVCKIAIPVRLGFAMEFAVAIVLILLGVGAASNLMRTVARRLFGQPPHHSSSLIVHSHSHTHAGLAHAHPHVHHGHSHLRAGADGDHSRAKAAAAHPREHVIHFLPREHRRFAARCPLMRSFAVGLVHGLSGSTAIALVVLSAIPQPLWATLYLAVFCLGTIIGMGLITTAIATPFIVASQRHLWLHNNFAAGAGLLSFGFGLFLAYRIGVVHRLFSAGPLWMPH
jgi:hypothetical protein